MQAGAFSNAPAFFICVLFSSIKSDVKLCKIVYKYLDI